MLTATGYSLPAWSGAQPHREHGTSAAPIIAPRETVMHDDTTGGGGRTPALLAIIDVLNRYGAAIDAGDWERLRSCFTTDATLVFPTRVIVGADAIVAHVAQATAWVAWQQHLLGSHQITLDGDRARATCALYATQVPRDPREPVRTTIGTYCDELHLTAEGWKIVHRELRVGFRREEGGAE